jgi:CRP/FNR family transcriptional regulator
MDRAKAISVADIISQSFFFSGLPLDTVEKIARITVVKKWPKGCLLFSQGQQATGFYILAQGQVRIFLDDPNGKERIIKIVLPGETFGEAAIFQTDGYPANAMALSDCVCLYWPQRDLKQLLQGDGDLALAVIGVLAQKLGHFASLMSASLKEAVPKVAAYLLQLPHTDDKLQLPPTKTIMALALGITAESLSRALGRLKRARLIAENPHLSILDRRGLEMVANGYPLRSGSLPED